jgi:hypothetical protein
MWYIPRGLAHCLPHLCRHKRSVVVAELHLLRDIEDMDSTAEVSLWNLMFRKNKSASSPSGTSCAEGTKVHRLPLELHL